MLILSDLLRGMSGKLNGCRLGNKSLHKMKTQLVAVSFSVVLRPPAGMKNAFRTSWSAECDVTQNNARALNDLNNAKALLDSLAIGSLIDNGATGTRSSTPQGSGIQISRLSGLLGNNMAFRHGLRS